MEQKLKWLGSKFQPFFLHLVAWIWPHRLARLLIRKPLDFGSWVGIKPRLCKVVPLTPNRYYYYQLQGVLCPWLRILPQQHSSHFDLRTRGLLHDLCEWHLRRFYLGLIPLSHVSEDALATCIRAQVLVFWKRSTVCSIRISSSISKYVGVRYQLLPSIISPQKLSLCQIIENFRQIKNWILKIRSRWLRAVLMALDVR